MQLTN